eukprot:4924469-Pyramimonas_sp.AAC.2
MSQSGGRVEGVRGLSRTIRLSWASVFYRPNGGNDKGQVLTGWKWPVSYTHLTLPTILLV